MRAAQPERRLEGMVMVTRERREGRASASRHPSTLRAPSAPVTTILSPCDGLGAGKLAG